MKNAMVLLLIGLLPVFSASAAVTSNIQSDPLTLHYEGGEGPQIVVTYSGGSLYISNAGYQSITYRIDWQDANGGIVYSEGKTVPPYSTISFYPLTLNFWISRTLPAPPPYQLSMYKIY